MTASLEFSRPLSIDGITPDKERVEKIEANDKECAALAKRFDLRDLSDFSGTLHIRRVAGGDLVRVAGTIKADVVQTCVVSLQDVHAHVEGDFETFFSEKEQDLPEDLDILLDDPESAPEMVVNGHIDLGEVAAQYLSLHLDPYPRAPGVSLAAQLAEVGAGGKSSPFAVLKGLGAEPATKAAKPAAPKTAQKPAAKAKPAAKKPATAGKPAAKKKGKSK